jgi:hypothetical protein
MFLSLLYIDEVETIFGENHILICLIDVLCLDYIDNVADPIFIVIIFQLFSFIDKFLLNSLFHIKREHN